MRRATNVHSYLGLTSNQPIVIAARPVANITNGATWLVAITNPIVTVAMIDPATASMGVTARRLERCATARVATEVTVRATGAGCRSCSPHMSTRTRNVRTRLL